MCANQEAGATGQQTTHTAQEQLSLSLLSKGLGLRGCNYLLQAQSKKKGDQRPDWLMGLFFLLLCVKLRGLILR